MPGERLLQLPLPNPEKGESFIFHAGTCIFPEIGGRGYLSHDIIATRLPKPIKGLIGFEAMQSPELWYDPISGVHSWTMRGVRFGAYGKSAHKITKK
jgi:hypothetical protein